MNRRQFLVGSAGMLGAVPAATSLASVPPCPPPILASDNQSVNTSCSVTTLAGAAAALARGQWSEFAEGANTNQSTRLDIQWQTSTLYYDPIRREAQYMGKPASSQSSVYSHYVYSESTGTWRRTQPPFQGLGHVWNHAFDPANGDYYTNQSAGSTIYRYTRSTDSWSVVTTIPSPYNSLSGSSWAGFGWHPNLFGPGDGGLVIHTVKYVCAWRKRDNSWHPIFGPFSSGDRGYNNAGGGDGVYFSDVDKLLLGTGHGGNTGANGTPLYLISAGASGTLSAASVTHPSDPPVRVFGAGGNSTAGKMIRHPADASAAILLEKSDVGSARWWITKDRGASWQLQSTKHPFSSWKQWTCTSIPELGVVWGIYSGHDGGAPSTRLWKPA